MQNDENGPYNGFFYKGWNLEFTNSSMYIHWAENALRKMAS